MATLERIRKRSGLLIVVIGVAMLAFILTDLLGSGGSMFSGDSTTVGKINGKSVEYNEFGKRMDDIQQRVAAQNPQNANLSRKQLADGAWDEFLREEIMGEQYDELGFTVTSQELYDRLKSDPGLQSAPAFQDQVTGGFSEALFAQYINNLKDQATADDQAALQYSQWLQYENSIRDRTEADKYNRAIEKGLYVPSKMARMKYIGDNTNSTVNFAALEFTSIADSTIEVSEADLKKYYSENKESYKSEDTRNIEFVVFNIEPSDEDRDAVVNELTEYRNGKSGDTISFINAKNDSVFADSRSDITPILPTYYREDNLPAGLDSSIFEQEVGYVTQPYLSGNYYNLTKVSKITNLPDSAKARHILISFAGANSGQSQSQRPYQEAQPLADSLLAVVKEDSTKFSELARQFSDDGSAASGGSLGSWFDDKQMVRPFSDFVFENDKGTIGLVFSRFGFHIIQVMDQKGSDKAVELVNISREFAPSNKTYDDVYNEASTFASEVQKMKEGDFSAEAEKRGYTPRPAAKIAPFDDRIPGLGTNRELVKWAHGEKTEIGDVTVINSEDQSSFIVVKLTDKQEEGYATLASIEDIIRPELIKEKKAEQFKEKIAKAAEGKDDIAAIAAELGVQMKNLSVNLATANLPGFGTEPKVVGAMSGIEVNKVSEPVTGNRGVYIFKVLNRTPAADLPDYNVQREQQQNTVRPRVAGKVFNSLKDEAKIKDNRSRFY